MPANLTPQYLQAEAKFKSARLFEEKLSALNEMIATIPKHKGTDKMVADLRKKLKKLKEENQTREKSGKRKDLYYVEKEGAGQIILAGYPNSGKSSLLSGLTNALSEIAEYPFTTTRTIPGMMEYENINFQLVDTPAISPDYMESWIIQVIRNADFLWLVCDVSDDNVTNTIDFILEKLKSHKINPVKEITQETEANYDTVFLKCMIVANKMDIEKSSDNLIILKELYSDRFNIIGVSALNKMYFEELKKATYENSGIIRVYTKIPGKEPDRTKPFIMKKGTTVINAAQQIHKDFALKFRYARIWGSEKYQGQMVERNYILKDEDIIEFHIQ